MEKTLATASLNDEASMVCMDSSSSCILMFADGASSKSRGTFEVFTPLRVIIHVNHIPYVRHYNPLLVINHGVLAQKLKNFFV